MDNFVSITDHPREAHTCPKNILWTLQSAREVLVLLDVRVNNIMAHLSEIDEEILKTNKCVVLEIKTDEPSNK